MKINDFLPDTPHFRKENQDGKENNYAKLW